MLLLVGGMPSPEGFSDSSVVLWDHAKRERVWEITLPCQVRAALRHRHDDNSMYQAWFA